MVFVQRIHSCKLASESAALRGQTYAPRSEFDHCTAALSPSTPLPTHLSPSTRREKASLSQQLADEAVMMEMRLGELRQQMAKERAKREVLK
jgi:hypothetical protein